MSSKKPLYQTSWFLFLGILFVSFNLRPSITAVGPLIPFIREDLQLSNGWAGFLTTFPLITFATFSLFSARIGKALGNSQAIMLGMVLILAGTIIRVLGGSLVLFLGTGLTGIGIVICNVLLIPLIKNRIPSKIGIVTASYTTGMTFLAAVASGISAPLAIDLDLGWRGSLLSWSILLVLGILVWLPQMRFQTAVNHAEQNELKVNVWKSRLAWNVSMFMGVQSLLFFTLIAWLPDMLISRGFSAVEAGVIVSLMQIIGLIGSFLAPIVAVKFKDQVLLIKVLGTMYLLGFSSLFIHAAWVNYIGLAIVGLGLGSSVSLAYTLIGLRTRLEKTTASLSGMVQSTGYYLAALGPLLFGVAFDVFQNWNFLIYLTLICSAMFIYFGVRAGKAVQI
ncbi:CynX/NimT family MFS transporter [Mongoliibacter ruber]|uniref:CP family cyanate transporter-like MFS transporter n=1 Tax=Mongoliibacter ruber TaxID=1750599 RepID=A0A2T0WQY3_9BACT|nr:MFS transporter [Mongoliibacter ruber]PRY89123.1 CP family cyanate transporter-like MFS transporter [Mongoliibacter ruber]